MQDVNLNSFYAEAYTFIRGLERTLVNTGWTLSAVRKMQETMGIQRRERLCKVWNRDQKRFMEKVIFDMGIEEQVSF